MVFQDWQQIPNQVETEQNKKKERQNINTHTMLN